MEYIDYYKILGIDKSATQKEIKNAYRKLARKYHPDLNPNDKDAKKNFQLINEAHEVLGDPDKRKKYDRYGKDWKHADEYAAAGESRYRTSGSGGRTHTSTHFDDSFSDFFENLFGSSTHYSGGKRIRFRGEDYTAELHLKLSDAYAEHKRTLKVNGKQIRITVPAGIESGQTIKITGHGGPGRNGGPNGDLFITFVIDSDSKFKRSGNDLYTSVEIDLFTAVLGGEITLDTLSGRIKMKVKPETQNGTKVKLRNKGFPVYKKAGQYGDLYITYKIRIPTNLTERQKSLFRELSKL
jgi:curved DNA-binding protein